MTSKKSFNIIPGNYAIYAISEHGSLTMYMCVEYCYAKFPNRLDYNKLNILLLIRDRIIIYPNRHPLEYFA